MWNEILNLLKTEQINSASSMLIKHFGDRLMQHLTVKYKWAETEATEIIHDSVIKFAEIVREKPQKDFPYTYFRKICELNGANKYRRFLRQDNLFKKYIQETTQEVYDDYYEKYGIQFEPLDEYDDYPEKHKIALRAYILLDEGCRQLLHLRYVEEVPYQYIPDKILNINSPDAARSKLPRCKKRWKQYIQLIQAKNAA